MVNNIGIRVSDNNNNININNNGYQYNDHILDDETAPKFNYDEWYCKEEYQSNKNKHHYYEHYYNKQDCCHKHQKPNCYPPKNEISQFAQSHINRYYEFMANSGLGDRIGLYG